jgi:hypothetical protein
LINRTAVVVEVFVVAQQDVKTNDNIEEQQQGILLWSFVCGGGNSGKVGVLRVPFLAHETIHQSTCTHALILSQALQLQTCRGGCSGCIVIVLLSAEHHR